MNIAVIVDRVLGIDWSGAAKTSSARIYAAEVVLDGARTTVASVVRAASRSAVARFLSGQRLELARGWEAHAPPEPPKPGEVVLAGLDFAFGFPAEFELPGRGNSWTWQQLANWCRHVDDAGSLLDAIEADPVTRRQFRFRENRGGTMLKRCAERELEKRGVHPESVLNLIGSRQVGPGSIRGIPMLARLRRAGAALWPLDSHARDTLTLVEVFPRLWLDATGSKENPAARVAQVKLWREHGVGFAAESDMLAAASPDAMDAVAAAIGLSRLDGLGTPRDIPAAILRREAWIAGV
jgi:hypothetical protein